MSAVDVVAPIIGAMESRYPERVIAQTVIAHARPILRYESFEEAARLIRETASVYERDHFPLNDDELSRIDERRKIAALLSALAESKESDAAHV